MQAQDEGGKGADSWKYLSFAQRGHYAKLREKMSQAELEDLSKRANFLQDVFYKKNYNVPLDRSYSSPLVD
jgi:hypothetical protein